MKLTHPTNQIVTVKGFIFFSNWTEQQSNAKISQILWCFERKLSIKHECANLLPNHLSSLVVQNYNLTLKVTLEQIHLDSVCWNCVLIMDCSSTSFLTDMKIYRAIMRLFLYCTSFLWRNCLPSLNMMEAMFFSPVCRLIRMMCSNPAVYLNFNLSQTWYTNCPKTESYI